MPSSLAEEAKLPKVYSQNGGKKSVENKCHGMHLTLSDRERVRVFVQDFCVQGLVPFVENQIRTLSDQVINRKGLHRSLFSATKKWFSGNKPGMQGPATSTTSVIYSQDAPELQVRKLGDLAFMFQLYDLAYQAYHNAKRDFYSDQAWLHYAGAMEMAALSVFMLGSSSQRLFPSHYLDSAITTYLNTCKSPVFATRSTLLSTECLKSQGSYSDAALHFIRMTSEDSDLRSALLLEQAAHCFINTKPSMIRKYAFHIILAGHRFSKAGQRKHALRAYKLAEQVYKGKNWRLADDHINFIIGRQSLNLKQLKDACTAFQTLLTEHSLQPAAQQATFLREYLFVLKLLNQSTHNKEQGLPSLPLPLIDSQYTKVLLGQADKNIHENCLLVEGRGFDKSDQNNNIWICLANLVIIAAHGSLPIIRPQLQCLTENTDNSLRPLSVVEEIITVELSVNNPLNVSLILSNIFLLWNFKPKINGKEDAVLTNESLQPKADIMAPVSEVLPEVNLEGLESKKIHLYVKPVMIGELHITGIAFTLQTLPSSNQLSINGEISGVKMPNPKLLSVSNVSVQGKQIVNIIGRRLNNTKAEKSTKVYGSDYRLKPLIIPHMPKLQVKFYNFSSVMFCGEVRQMNVEFTNIGHCTLYRILVASPNPAAFMFGTSNYELDEWMVYKETACSENQSSPVMAECPKIEPVCEILSLDGNSCQLQSGESLSVPMWIRGPDVCGNHTIDFLFYYEAEEPQEKMRYRLLQHSANITTLPSLNIKSETMPSFSFSNSHFNHCTSSANSFVLSVQAENISEGQGTEISILQVSCVSQDWCLYPLTDAQGHGAISIQQQEAVLLAMKAVPFNSRNTVCSQNVMVFSQVPLGRTEVDSSATPCCDFSWRSQLRLQNQSTLVEKYPDVDFENETFNIIHPLNEIGLTLTVLWKAKVERDNHMQVVVGQHHITLEKVNSCIKALPSTKLIEQRPPIHIIPDPEEMGEVETASCDLTDQAVKCTITNYPFHVQHNFSAKRLLRVPVTLVVHNCCQTDVYITISMQEEIKSITRSPVTTPSSPQELCQGLGSQGFSWIGLCQWQLHLKPGSTTHLPLQACFSSPGAYVMGNIKVTAGLKMSDIKIEQQCMPPYLIMISDNK